MNRQETQERSRERVNHRVYLRALEPAKRVPVFRLRSKRKRHVKKFNKSERNWKMIPPWAYYFRVEWMDLGFDCMFTPRDFIADWVKEAMEQRSLKIMFEIAKQPFLPRENVWANTVIDEDAEKWLRGQGRVSMLNFITKGDA